MIDRVEASVTMTKQEFEAECEKIYQQRKQERNRAMSESRGESKPELIVEGHQSMKTCAVQLAEKYDELKRVGRADAVERLITEGAKKSVESRLVDVTDYIKRLTPTRKHNGAADNGNLTHAATESRHESLVASYRLLGLTEAEAECAATGDLPLAERVQRGDLIALFESTSVTKR